MELADVLDSKSSGSDTVPVRPRSPAPNFHTYILSGCSAVGSALGLGPRCRGFKSLHSDHENPCKLEVYKGFSLFIKPSKIMKCTQVFHSTSGNFFVFKPVPHSLTYAVKFFTSAKRKRKGELRLSHILRLVSPLLPQLSLHGFL